MIQEAVQEAVSRAAVEFGRGRSVGREGVALESLGGSVVGMDIEPDIINPPTPLRAALTPTTALGHISMPMRQRILGHKYADLKLWCLSCFINRHDTCVLCCRYHALPCINVCEE